jgi:hypothetical protein
MGDDDGAVAAVGAFWKKWENFHPVFLLVIFFSIAL